MAGETKLNMNGSPMTVSAMAWLAVTAEKYGEAHVVNCAIAAAPGMAAVWLGAELQRVGFFDGNKEG